MKILSNSHRRFVGIVMAFAATGLTSPAHATDFFVNNTGAPVTDFHFDQFTDFVPRQPRSEPWGKGTLTNLGDGNYRMTYSGPAIPVGGKLRFNQFTFTDDATHEYSNFVWTPGGQSATLERDSSVLPEPNMWLTMLVGFGAMGGVMRARRKTAVSFA